MKVRHQGGAVAEVPDDYGVALVETGEWEVVEAATPKPVRAKRTPKVAVADKPEGAVAAEE